MVNENEAMNVAEEAIDDAVCVDGLKSKKAIKAPIIVLCVGVAVAGVAALLRKHKRNKNFIEVMKVNKAIKYLEKNGYTVDKDLEPLFDENEDVEVNPEKE